MKNTILNFGMAFLLGIGMAGCGNGAQKSDGADSADENKADLAQVVDTVTKQIDTVANQVDSVSEAPVVEPAIEDSPAVESTEDADIALIKQFYKKCVLEGGGFSSPKKYCTAACLKKLAAAYDYDDGGYAVWEFRTDGADGGGPSKVTNVQPIGNGWYKVSYLDTGVKGWTNVLVKEGKIADYNKH